MFYNDRSKPIDTNLSYLDPQQVFTGQYWDEFGMTSFLIPDNARVLMLGLSLGGGIRPLLSSTKNIELTGVDIDGTMIAQCRSFFAENFPRISFKTATADARNFLDESRIRYDLIWLDIYASDAYTDLCFDYTFLNLIKNSLTPQGVLAVNAYGIPNQFEPLAVHSIQRELAYRLQQTFHFVGNLPFRRNQTLLASASSPTFFPASAHPQLSVLDKKSFAVQSCHLQTLSLLPKIQPQYIDLAGEMKFTRIDQMMLTGWRQLLVRLQKYNLNFQKPAELLTFLQDQNQCAAFLDQTLSRGDDLSAFVPILCAGQSHMQVMEIDWIFAWLDRNQTAMRTRFPETYRQIWLPQLWALVVHPSKRYRSFCFQIFHALRECL